MNAGMQTQYRNYGHGPGQTPQRAAHPQQARRGPGLMSGAHAQQSQHNAAALNMQRQQAQRDQEELKRRATRPTDKNMPDDIEDLVMGDGVQEYKNLREIEKRLDATMMRKRLDLADARYGGSGNERMGVLRIWISNTADNQPWQSKPLDENAFDFSGGSEGTYRVKIEGRLLDEEDMADMALASNTGERNEDAMDEDKKEEPAKKPRVGRRKLAHFFKQITVEYDRSRTMPQDGVMTIDWKRPTITNLPPVPAADFDCLEFERKADENINCTINLYRDEMPEKYQLDRGLADIVGKPEASLTQISTAILDYAQALELLQDDEKRLIQCDDRLRNLFRTDTIFFPRLQEVLVSHLSPLPPIKLAYTIRVDPEYQLSPAPTIYDIRVPVEDPSRLKALAMLNDPKYVASLTDLARHDEQLTRVVHELNVSKARHQFLTSLSKDPANFIKKWTLSQSRDLEIILGEARSGGGEEGLTEEFRRGGRESVWNTDLVRESVGLMIAKR